LTPSLTIVAIDLILVVLTIELLVLAALARSAVRRHSALGLIATVMSGLMLVVALRLLAMGWHIAWIAVCLFGSGLFHFVDFRGRLRSPD
jgi:hypothetical protein